MVSLLQHGAHGYGSERLWCLLLGPVVKLGSVIKSLRKIDFAFALDCSHSFASEFDKSIAGNASVVFRVRLPLRSSESSDFSLTDGMLNVDTVASFFPRKCRYRIQEILRVGLSRYDALSHYNGVCDLNGCWAWGAGCALSNKLVVFSTGLG